MTRILEYLTRHRPGPVRIVALLLLVLVGAIDYETGREYAFAFFYLVPVALFAWTNGTAGMVVSACLSTAVLVTVDVLTGYEYSNPFVHVWDACSRVAMFLVVGGLLVSLKSSLEKEKHLARTDPLTGIANARRLQEFGERELARAGRHRLPVTMAYLDVDDFKEINDRFGHEAGDELLRELANALQRSTRTTDVVARVGGDEFAILLPDVGEPDALTVIDALPDRVGEVMTKWSEHARFSIGAVTFTTPPETVDELISRSDAVMYKVKASGKGTARHETETSVRLR